MGYAHVARHGYLKAHSDVAWPWEEWTHVALSFDGTTLRFFVDGALQEEAEHAGRITANRLPLFIGADPDPRGEPMSFFSGFIDEVRISSVARYLAPFTPDRVHESDEDTVLLFHFDGEEHGLYLDDSDQANHGRRVGEPRLVDEIRR